MKGSVTRSGTIALLYLLMPLSVAHCIELTFNPMVSTNFEEMSPEQAISTLSPPWTGVGASSIVADLPAGNGNSGSMAITGRGTTRLTALSPQQILPPTFTEATTNTTIYFSAWLLHNGGGGSVVFNSINSASGYTFTLGGFGITGGATRNFSYLTDADGNGLPEMTNSVHIPERNTWYEVALVVRFDYESPENSLGYVYYRKIADTEFTLLPEFENGVKMSWWTSTFNARNFAHYRIDNARNNFQIGSLSVGIINPKPGVNVRPGTSVTTLEPSGHAGKQ